MRLFKAAERVGFVVIHVEDGEQLSDDEQVLDFFRQIQKFQLAAAASHRRVVRDQFADAARVDVPYPFQVQQNLLIATGNQITNRAAQRRRRLDPAWWPRSWSSACTSARAWATSANASRARRASFSASVFAQPSREFAEIRMFVSICT